MTAMTLRLGWLAWSLTKSVARLGFVLAAVVCLGWMYAPLLSALVSVWHLDPDYSHGPLIPLASLLLILQEKWRRDHAFLPRCLAIREGLAGAGFLALALAMHVLAWLLNSLQLDAVSLVLLSCGLLLGLGGRDALQAYSFPVLFLLFAVPLPEAWYQLIANALQSLVSASSAVLLSAFGVPVYRQGYVLHVPNCSLEVAPACAGLRQITAFAALGAMAAALHRGSWAVKLTLLFLAIPVAVFVNVLRVTLTGMLVLYDPELARGTFHTLEGLALTLLGATILLGLSWLSTNAGGRSNRRPTRRPRDGR